MFLKDKKGIDGRNGVYLGTVISMDYKYCLPFCRPWILYYHLMPSVLFCQLWIF